MDSSNFSNSTCPQQFSTNERLINGLATPLIITLGLLSNLLNVAAFLDKTQRQLALNWYLISLSVSDFVALCSSIVMISLPVFSEASMILSFQNFANYGIVVTYPIGMIAQTASVYFTVASAAHRFVGVVFPFQSAQICSRKSTKITIGSLVIFSLVYNFSRFFELRTDDCLSADNIPYTVVAMTDFRLNFHYKTIYIMWMYTICMLVVPFILLICLNIRVIFEVQKSRRHHLLLSCGGPATDDEFSRNEAQKERNTTVMLVGVSLKFLLCNAMALVCNSLELMQVQSEAFSEAVVISNLLVILNMSVNTFIYWSFSSKFRHAAANVICCKSQ